MAATVNLAPKEVILSQQQKRCVSGNVHISASANMAAGLMSAKMVCAKLLE